MKPLVIALVALSLLANVGLTLALVFVGGELHQSSSAVDSAQWKLQDQINNAQEKVDRGQDRILMLLDQRIDDVAKLVQK